ncbi:MAG: Crp/Fnr family transcriptional regulator [Chitinophagaceae bacterium]|nr:Crp/Fnr family transcriptional regulator [Chitinophagaceae bacterium]
MWDLFHKHISRYVSLTEKEFEPVKSFFVPRRYKKKQFILQEGDVCRHESFIVKGCTRTYDISPEGQEHILQFGIEDWWIGDLYSYLSGTASRCNIDCIEDTEVLQITREQQEALFAEVPAMERFFRILIQNAFIASQSRILTNLSRSGKERYADFIAQYPLIDQRVPDHQIASYLGLTPQSLSRIRSRRV